MSGRRSSPRYQVPTPWNGTIRVLHEVVATRTGAREVLVLSQTCGVVGERLSLELIAGGLHHALTVEVRESRPVIIEGAVRHRLRLAILAGATPDGWSHAAEVGAESVEATKLEVLGESAKADTL